MRKLKITNQKNDVGQPSQSTKPLGTNNTLKAKARQRVYVDPLKSRIQADQLIYTRIKCPNLAFALCAMQQM